MERCEALLVHLVYVGATLNELIHHHILPVVARHVEGCVAIRIGLIDLDGEMKRGVVITSQDASLFLKWQQKSKTQAVDKARL